MSLFAISDPHLSLGTDKPMDIFRGWDNYTVRIEQNWRGAVSDEDTVILPGDISWAMKLPDTYKDFAFLHSLPGKKIIMKGNHDLWWSSMTKMQQYLCDCGFDDISILHNNTVTAGDFALAGSRGWFFDDGEGDKKVLLREAGRIDMSLSAAEKTGLPVICFLHYPPLTREAVCDEIFSVLKRHGVTRCYYGHIHHGGCYNAFCGEYDGVYLECVSCDMMNFSPLLIEKY